MKILQLSVTDLKGGAGRAAYRLHRGLIQKGVDSRMLVRARYSEDPSVEPIDSGSKFWRFYNQIRPLANKAVQKLQKTPNTVFHSANFLPSGLQKRINNSDADIIHLHWVGAEMISVKEISNIDKPLVWTFHDMWAFCGAEHYDDLQFPGRYIEGYKKDNRPVLHSGFDLDRWTWKRKKSCWQNKPFFIVTPSTWLANRVRESALMGDRDIRVIPNGLDMDVYSPKTKQSSRKKLNVDDEANARYLLFGAKSAGSDERKGYGELQKALKKLADKESGKRYRLIVFGTEGHDDLNWGIPVTFLGSLDDEKKLAEAYSAADVMLVPSLQDNLPNTAVESIACGTPVVAFNIGGVPDIIDHRKNGYLAEPYDIDELASGIEWVLDNDERLSNLSGNARKKAIECFSLDIIVAKYQELYEEVLHKNG